MKKSRIRQLFAIAIELLRFVIIIPFVPLAIGLVFFFGWCIGKASEIPEDLDEQVRMANKTNLWLSEYL